MIHEDKSASVSTPTSAFASFAGQPVIGRAGRNIEITKLTQEGMLAGTQEVFDRWCARRRQSTEALAVFSRDALTAKSPQDVMQIWVHWTKGVMDRLLEDAKDQMAVGASAARHVANGTTALALAWAPIEENQVKSAADRMNGEDTPTVRH